VAVTQQAVFGTRAWTWNEQRQQYYLHQFAAGQPDLNYRNSKVVQAMKDVLLFWMDKGADGFRIDAVEKMTLTMRVQLKFSFMHSDQSHVRNCKLGR
jgi:glycosidase